MQDSSLKPHPKVAAAGVAGATSIILVYALEQCGLHIPAEVAAAITTILSFGGGYLKASA